MASGQHLIFCFKDIVRGWGSMKENIVTCEKRDLITL